MAEFTPMKFDRVSAARATLSAFDRVSPRLAGWLTYEMFCYPQWHPVAKTKQQGNSGQYRMFARAEQTVTTYRDRGRTRPVTIYRFAAAGDEPADGTPRRAVLLAHGWSSAAMFMTAFVELLNRRGFDVVTFDMPAHGQSGRVKTNMVECARAMQAVVEATPDLHGIIAHSFGAAVVALVCEGGAPMSGPVRAPKKLATISAPNSFLHVTRSYGKALQISHGAQLDYERRLSDLFERKIDDLTCAGFLRGLPTDVLVMHCKDDADISFGQAHEFVQGLPSAKLQTFSGLGHRRVLYTPKVVRAAIEHMD
ncbi:MAG: alpha/beta hydrolase [Pseudomonadota bacterium]